MPDLSLECKAGATHGKIICGVDEAGRGPLAGPVVAAAVILPMGDFTPAWLNDLNDSKKLSAKKRDHLAMHITSDAIYGVGEATVDEIDELNILQATFLSMRRAVANLSQKPDIALIDGNLHPKPFACETRAIVKGDSLSASIAAASIIAKTRRDQAMIQLAEQFPHYGWENNAGYGTAQHRQALQQFGPCLHHRKSFAPISQLLLPID